MSKVVSRSGLGLLLAAAVVAGVLYLVFNNAFGGPQVRVHEPYEASAWMDDTQALLKKSVVLLHGVSVGSIEDVDVQGERARVTFSIQDRYAPMYRNATVQLGNRSLLGEPYLELDPGSPKAGALPNHATLPPRQVLDNVEFDEALQALAPRALGHLRGSSLTVARAVRSPLAAPRIHAGAEGFVEVVHELRGLTGELRAQRHDLAGLVDHTGSTLSQLGERERRLRGIVSDGHATLDALGTREHALVAALRETPPLLHAARGTLADARPLIGEARPLVARTRAVLPLLPPTLDDTAPVARDAAAILARLPRTNHAVLPTLALAKPVATDALPVADNLLTALRNLAPFIEYAQPLTADIAGAIASMADTVSKGDARGLYARNSPVYVLGSALGLDKLQGALFDKNPYPRAGQAATLQPFGHRPYPRLLPAPPG